MLFYGDEIKVNIVKDQVVCDYKEVLLLMSPHSYRHPRVNAAWTLKVGESETEIDTVIVRCLFLPNSVTVLILTTPICCGTIESLLVPSSPTRWHQLAMFPLA